MSRYTRISSYMLCLIGLLGLVLFSCGRNLHSELNERADNNAETPAPQATGQELTAIQQLGIYLVGLHPMKEHPDHQMMAHHFCQKLNADLTQCVLFNDNTKDARMNGIEYIITETLFESLPPEEQQYWHPHNYEILSGQLLAPGMPEADEKELMRANMNSYGKTFHTWMDEDAAPLGAPKLAWSLNHDGEAKQGLLPMLTEKFGVDLQAKKESRSDLTEQAKPQSGVDALKWFFGDLPEIPGVKDKNEETHGLQPGAHPANGSAQPTQPGMGGKGMTGKAASGMATGAKAAESPKGANQSQSQPAETQPAPTATPAMEGL